MNLLDRELWTRKDPARKLSTIHNQGRNLKDPMNLLGRELWTRKDLMNLLGRELWTRKDLPGSCLQYIIREETCQLGN